jgi:glycosyltransferase involved in cell wall biosynthesis
MPDPPALPAISQEPISVILLARNNEETVEQTLRGWTGTLSRLKREYEVIVVDDASADRTVELARAVAASGSVIHIHEHLAASGIGAALRTGISVSRYPLLLYSTLDGRYSHLNLTVCLKAIDKVHIVSGYRVWRTAHPRRRVVEVIRKIVARLLFGVRLRDVDCAFKLFRRVIFSRLPIQSNGPFVHLEILAKANFLGLVMTDIAVDYRERSGGQPPAFDSAGRWRDGWRVFANPDFGPVAPRDMLGV